LQEEGRWIYFGHFFFIVHLKKGLKLVLLFHALKKCGRLHVIFFTPLIMKFQKLTITDWKQFQFIDIDFHQNLTVFTGANGSGKTTILNLLARHFGWSINELATPAKDESTGFLHFLRVGLKAKPKKTRILLAKFFIQTALKQAWIFLIKVTKRNII